VAGGDEFPVNTYTSSYQSTPFVASDDQGDFIVAWQGLNQDGDGWGVYAQRYTVAPLVAASEFRFNTTPHRLQFSFDEIVSGSLGTEDLVVQNLTTGHTIPAGDFSVGYDPLSNTATFNYNGSAGGIPAVLPDGKYRATLLASGISTPNGQHLPADYVFDFHFLMGDANHDGRVNLHDFNTLAANFGQSPRDFTQGDFNYDGVVNLVDFNILAGRFGAQLAPLASPVGAPSQRPFDARNVYEDLEDLLNRRWRAAATSSRR
jgi:hypothetical protein